MIELRKSKKGIKYIKTALSVFMVLTVSLFMLTACGDDSLPQGSKGEKIKIVCTTFPQYDWVREVAGEQLQNMDLTLLLDDGVDLHSYQPTAEDIIKINESDLFIYVGGESDDWVEEVLKQGDPENRPSTMNLVAVLGDMAKEEVVKEGMEHNHNHEHGHDHDGEEHHHEEHDAAHEHEGEEHHHEHEGEEHHHHAGEYDEHVWLSLRNAEEICEHIAEELGELDPKNSELYEANAEKYIAKLDSLDKKYEVVVSKVKNPTVVFADRFPFRYMMDDYGIDYYAAFTGCSAETEASFETVVFLANKVDEMGLKNVVVIDRSNEKIARTVISNTGKKNQNIISMNSMQTVTAKDVVAGTSYLKIMTDNLESLKEAI